MENIMNELREWVIENYNQKATGYSIERSMGNYDDVFQDGYEYGQSWAAYKIGSILGMQLADPVQDEDDALY